MPTIAGIRRRGYTPESIRLFCERIGVSKADSWIDMSVLEQALRDDLDARAPRASAVLAPLKLVIVRVGCATFTIRKIARMNLSDFAPIIEFDTGALDDKAMT